MDSIKDIHIGKLILHQMKIQRISYAQLGRELHLDRSTVYWMTKQKSVDSERLYNLSRILQFDFFKIAYQPLFPESMRQQSEHVDATLRATHIDPAQLEKILSNIHPTAQITIHIHISPLEP